MSVCFKQIIRLKKFNHSQISYKSNINNIRSFRNSHLIKNENKGSSNKIPKMKPFSTDGNEDHTWVGPPHPESNLRLKIFPSSRHHTEEEAHFYQRSKEVQDWNQEYWVSHNRDFEQSKKSYIERKTKEKNVDTDTSLNTEEMADFYREFLNKNYNKHLLYNWQWYQKNFELLYLSVKAKIAKLRKVMK